MVKRFGDRANRPGHLEIGGPAFSVSSTWSNMDYYIPDTDYKLNLRSELQRGDLPDQIVYLSDKWVEKFNHPLPLGHILKVYWKKNDIRCIYIVKEYKDGWYKLEWPD